MKSTENIAQIFMKNFQINHQPGKIIMTIIFSDKFRPNRPRNFSEKII